MNLITIIYNFGAINISFRHIVNYIVVFGLIIAVVAIKTTDILSFNEEKKEKKRLDDT